MQGHLGEYPLSGMHHQSAMLVFFTFHSEIRKKAPLTRIFPGKNWWLSGLFFFNIRPKEEGIRLPDSSLYDHVFLFRIMCAHHCLYGLIFKKSAK